MGGNASPFSRACTNGVQLNTHTDTTCNLQCQAGYSGSNAELRCASDAMFGMDAITSISCVENTCAVYSWPSGVRSVSTGSAHACNEDTRLSTHTNPSCVLTCESGYTGQDATLTCPSDASNDQAPTTNISCVENSCAEFSFDPSIVTTNSRSDACTNSVTLSTRTYSTCKFFSCILLYHIHTHPP